MSVNKNEAQMEDPYSEAELSKRLDGWTVGQADADGRRFVPSVFKEVNAIVKEEKDRAVWRKAVVDFMNASRWIYAPPETWTLNNTWRAASQLFDQVFPPSHPLFAQVNKIVTKS